MLHFFAKRLKELQEVERDERGFTLIELLVVIIIIGVLAAIAIPVFLAQREKAWEAAAKSDLRNAAAGATSCSADNDGSFITAAIDCTDPGTLETYGYNKTTDVTLTAGGQADGTTWWGRTTNDLDDGTTFSFYTDVGADGAAGDPQ